MPEDTKPSFPRNFLWGASTSSHQVEGGNHNQWSEWEIKNAEKLAAGAEKTYDWLPNWKEVKSQAISRDNYISSNGVDHYHKYKQDFKLLKKLNLNAYRFGIEWSRIEPEEGKWDEGQIEYYRKYIKELNSLDIEPILNIWHWTVPVWFDKKGGFAKRKNAHYFAEYVHRIAREYRGDLRYIITLNEPNIFATFSYQLGLWPPQIKNIFKCSWVYWNLVRCHRKAYYLIKHEDPSIQVGVAAQLANIQAKRPHNFFDQVSTKVMRYIWNWWFLLRIKREQDFIGVNYYFTDYYTGLFKRENPKVPLNDIGFYMEPEGLYPLLLRTWVRFHKPIIVTENGVADAKDEYRRWWIEETIVAMQRAISEGVRIMGYFHWSLLDNFEWSYGWWPKFGLVEVDRKKKMRRTIRPSAKWFAAKIKDLSI